MQFLCAIYPSKFVESNSTVIQKIIFFNFRHPVYYQAFIRSILFDYMGRSGSSGKQEFFTLAIPASYRR